MSNPTATTDLADLFPGFDSHWIETDEGRFFARTGGSGPPLLLLHGYPQTHVEWHAVAPDLARQFTVVAMDLRGYGQSFVPASRADAPGATMSKRAMGQDAVAVMAALGHERFRLVGHDRGGRVAYRLAFDQPERLEKLVVIDIVPTASVFRGMGETGAALRVFHWLFLAQPTPFPETMIGKDPIVFLEHALASWSVTGLSGYHPAALAHYRQAFAVPARIGSGCEDYRAGAFIDRLLDEADLAAGRKIKVPMLAIWGDAGIPSSGMAPLDLWRAYAEDVRGQAIRSGHFVPEENPRDCAAALLEFLR